MLHVCTASLVRPIARPYQFHTASPTRSCLSLAARIPSRTLRLWDESCADGQFHQIPVHLWVRWRHRALLPPPIAAADIVHRQHCHPISPSSSKHCRSSIHNLERLKIHAFPSCHSSGLYDLMILYLLNEVLHHVQWSCQHILNVLTSLSRDQDLSLRSLGFFFGPLFRKYQLRYKEFRVAEDHTTS